MRLRWRWLLVAWLVALPAFALDSKDFLKAYDATRKGNEALLKGNKTKATRAYSVADSRVTSFPAARLGLGHISMALGQDGQALAHYNAAVEGYQRYGDALVEVERLRHEDAMARIEALTDKRADFVKRMAELQDKEGLKEIESSRQMLELQAEIRVIDKQVAQLRAVAPPGRFEIPGDVEYHLGNALYALDRLEEAAAAWAECARKIPEFAIVHNNLAFVYWKLGQDEQARASLEQAERYGFEVDPRLRSQLVRD